MRLNTLTIVLLGVASLGTVHFLEKLAIQRGAPPLPFALGQVLISLLALWPVWLWKRQRDGLRLLHCGRLGALARIGVLASGVVLLLGIVALNYTSATLKGVVQAAYPLGTLFFAWVLLRERIGLGGYLAAGIIVSGLVLITREDLRGDPALGDWLLLATIPVMGFTDAYAKKVLRDVPPVTVSLGRYLFGSAFLAVLLLGLRSGSAAELLPVWPLLLASGLLAALAMGLFYWSIKRLGASLAAGFLATAPVVTAALEWGWFGAALDGTRLLGLALVVAGAIALSRARP